MTKIAPFLHEFFCAGGTVHINNTGRKKYDPLAINYPADWEYDSELADKAMRLANELFNSKTPFPHYTSNEVAEMLQITYRKVVELRDRAELGGIKTSGTYKIYPPSVESYLKRLNRKPDRAWYDARVLKI